MIDWVAHVRRYRWGYPRVFVLPVGDGRIEGALLERRIVLRAIDVPTSDLSMLGAALVVVAEMEEHLRRERPLAPPRGHREAIAQRYAVCREWWVRLREMSKEEAWRARRRV